MQEEAIEQDLRELALNDSQVRTVSKALTMPCGVHCIQGPPGTGKTHMLAVLLELAARLEHRSLVCTPTNVALREICERFLQRALRQHAQEGGQAPATAEQAALGKTTAAAAAQKELGTATAAAEPQDRPLPPPRF